jgi:hypothetical protein
VKGAHAYPGVRPVLAGGLVLVAAIVVALVLATGSGARPGGTSLAKGGATIPAGFDLFETDPAQTVFSFKAGTTIPADFFAPGSKQFQGDVNFGGNPILQFQGKDAGDADTVIKHDAGSIPSGGTSAPVPIELVTLSLVAMAPIDVVVGTTTQRWDVSVDVSPTRPSKGDFTAFRTSATGGTFDSQLTVYPRFTFTRLSDGATKVLDVGALPDDQRPTITLTTIGTPWRDGCVNPALAIPGLNDHFCAGQSANGVKRLTLQQSSPVTSGVWPVQPRLEHFLCYSVGQHSRFKPRDVQLRDQFKARKARITGTSDFCNPARKNSEPFVNKVDHTRCYATTGASVNRKVKLRNQFGPFEGVVTSPRRLCLPSKKQIVGGTQPPKTAFKTDHFQCYGFRPAGTFPTLSTTFSDQFGKLTTKFKLPVLLCAPAGKNKTPVRHRVHHLVCYKRLSKTPAVVKNLIVSNQFGRETLQTKSPDLLCVPTVKLAE